jgi:probable addiction module antidote protein
MSHSPNTIIPKPRLQYNGIREESCYPEATAWNQNFRAIFGGSMENKKPSDFKHLRNNPAAISKHLDKAFATNDLRIILEAINSAMRAQNVLALAESAGLRRDRLYKTFGGDVNPQLGRVMELFAGLDVRLAVKALPPKQKPPRPKLGRPPTRKLKAMASAPEGNS